MKVRFFLVLSVLLVVTANRVQGANAADEALATARSFLDGRERERDERAAVVALRISADLGNAEAAERLAELLLAGPALSKSRAIALAQDDAMLRAKKADELTETESSRLLANMRETMPQSDPPAAAQYFALAAAAGRPSAALFLAAMHLKAQGIPRDLATVRVLYRQAADVGDAKAMHMLGVLAELGLDLDPDLGEADVWQRRAAERGEPRATIAYATRHLAPLWAREVMPPLRVPSSGLRPAEADSGRSLTALVPLTVIVRDGFARRTFFGLLAPGERLNIAAVDADLELTGPHRPGYAAAAAFATFNHDGVTETLTGETNTIRRRITAALPHRNWTIVAEQEGARAFRAFTGDGALSLPKPFAPFAFPDDDARASIPEQPDLWLDIRPGARVTVTDPSGSTWSMEAPSGVLVRLRLDQVATAPVLGQALIPDGLPSELEAKLGEGAPFLHAPDGQVVGWALKADDYALPSLSIPVVLPSFTVPAAVVMAANTGGANFVRAARIWTTWSIHAFGPISDRTLAVGITLAQALNVAGRRDEAQREADHWAGIAAALHAPGSGPTIQAMTQASLMRVERDLAAGRLPLAATTIRAVLKTVSILAQAFPPTQTGGVWIAMATDPVNTVYSQSLQVLRRAYEAAGEIDRSAAIIRRQLLLTSLNDPAATQNGEIELYLDLAGILPPEIAALCAELSRQQSKRDAFLRDVAEPLPDPLPPVPGYFQSMFGNSDTSLTYAKALTRLGRSYDLLRRYGEARPLLRRAATIVTRATAQGDPRQAEVFGALADAETRMGDMAAATTAARLASDIEMTSRRRAVAEDGRAALTLEAGRAVERMLGLLVARPAAERATILPDAFALIGLAMQDDLGEAVRSADNAAIAVLMPQLAATRTAVEEAEKHQDVAAARAARARLDSLLGKLRAAAPRRQAIGWDALRAGLAPSEAVLLAWVGPTRAFTMAAGPGGVAFAEIPGGSPLLRRTAAAFRLHLTQRGQVTDEEAAQQLETALQLHRMVITPVVAALSGAVALRAIVDGPLRGIPLEAIRDSHGWLGEMFAVSYVPGLPTPGERRAEPQNRADVPFFGIGAPIPAIEDQNALPPLPEALAQLGAVAEIAGGRATEILLGERATKALMRASPLLPDARIVAFATHGLVAGEAAKGSGRPALLLTGASQDDRYLDVAEIEAMRLRASLIILWACNTAASDGSLGSIGLSGLARSFIQAGAKSVLATHWRVREDAVALFAKQLITRWKEGRTLAEAKTAAQRDLRTADPAYQHPFYWAGFVILGDGGARWPTGPAASR